MSPVTHQGVIKVTQIEIERIFIDQKFKKTTNFYTKELMNRMTKQASPKGIHTKTLIF